MDSFGNLYLDELHWTYFHRQLGKVKILYPAVLLHLSKLSRGTS